MTTEALLGLPPCRPAPASGPRPRRSPASVAAPSGPPWCGRACSRSRPRRRPGRARHRRRHRRVRGPGRRARPPGPRRRPQPRRPGLPRPAGPRERGRGHRAAGRPRRRCSTSPTPGSADVVLCHGVLEVVDDPAAALATIAEVLRPGGVLSLLVAQRHAAVVARAMAGHFEQARAILDGGHPAAAARPDAPAAGSPTTSSTTLLPAAGFTRSPRPTPSGSSPTWCPARLLDLEPGATAALLELEQAVSERPEYRPARRTAPRRRRPADPGHALRAGGSARCATTPGTARSSTSTWTPSTPPSRSGTGPTWPTCRSIVGGGSRGVVLSANYLARGVRRPLGHADDPGPPALPAGGGRRPRLRHLLLGLDVGDRDLPPGHPAGRGALPRRGVPRRPRRHPPARLAAADRRAAARGHPRRAGRHLLGRGGRRALGRQAGQPPGQARRRGGRAAGRGRRRSSHPLDVGELYGVGEKTAAMLHRLGLVTVGDVARTPLRTLQRAVGHHLGAPPPRAGLGRRPAADHLPQRERLRRASGRPTPTSRWGPRRRSAATPTTARSSSASCCGWPTRSAAGCGWRGSPAAPSPSPSGSPTSPPSPAPARCPRPPTSP